MEQNPWETYSCSAIQEHLQFLELRFQSLCLQQPATI